MDYIKHSPDGDLNQPHRSNAQKVPFFNADKQFRKLGQGKKDENKQKSSLKPKYEQIKIAKPELLEGGFKHTDESA